MDHTLSPLKREEDAQEERLRPLSLSEFQGKEEIKENLRVFIHAARQRGEALDHVFLSGPPGLGKTTLGSIIAHELGVELRITSAPALEKPKDLAGILTTLSPRSVLFIDEIHRLKPAIEEMLYVAMEDYVIDWIIGQGPSARTVRIPVPPFTLVGATTKAGKLATPLVSRFGITFHFNLYEKEDIIKVLRRSARILGLQVEEPAFDLLSSCSRGTPRIANRMLRRARDFAEVYGKGVITPQIVRLTMDRLGIDEAGLEAHDRRILDTIITKFDGGPVGAESLAIALGESVDTLEDFYEPYLIQCGFLQRTPRGRIVTPRGYDHLNIQPRGKDSDDETQRLLF
ncbi:Holliday junction branch migration DNA helicase RuvB [Spirochaeta thermophila]|uniref:Holliday junction branch migration complex subunit RuvB n=1 Tax=Winmispira thermophila (strain ATCC 49972 / DSM 6192 / RI 19.B1) TaxID=665571 RepID=E0RST8_WINT6|nr:Holliday junction branch migration DNA helicase RuvB [Spirochaeta thermophila]ADN02075.1 holliday junction ATP-dependent DNA helicase RuvB [Spirochaeta thermophila DSM 6192]